MYTWAGAGLELGGTTKAWVGIRVRVGRRVGLRVGLRVGVKVGVRVRAWVSVRIEA